jgi:recombination protein RecA
MKLKKTMKRLSEAMSAIERQFGKGAVMRLGEAKTGAEVPSFSSGSLGLDKALGGGGYPRGRIVEIYGPESSGKTTLALHAIAEVQRLGGTAAFVDAEHALEPIYAARLGVETDDLLVSQPDCGEQALEIASTLIRSEAISLVVIDSVAALVPRAELEGEIGDHHVGLQARMMSQAMRMITGATHRTGATVIFINQTRQKVGVQFGSPETTTGGNALKFYASLRLDVRRIGQIKEREADDAVGNRTRVKVVKNKLAPPFRKVEFEIRFGKGINRAAELLDLGLESGLVTKSGSWFSLGDERLGQGREKAIAEIESRPELAERIAKPPRSQDDSGRGDEAEPEKKSDSEQAA